MHIIHTFMNLSSNNIFQLKFNYIFASVCKHVNLLSVLVFFFFVVQFLRHFNWPINMLSTVLYNLLSWFTAKMVDLERNDRIDFFQKSLEFHQHDFRFYQYNKFEYILYNVTMYKLCFWKGDIYNQAIFLFCWFKTLYSKHKL